MATQGRGDQPLPEPPPNATGKRAKTANEIVSCRGTARSLAAFDVDKTVLHQGDAKELERFRAQGGLAQTMVRLARLDFRLAAITGNSLTQLTTRFLRALVEELCEQRVLRLLSRFHFFCTGAALYVHFDPQRSGDFAALLAKERELEPEALLIEARRCLLDDSQKGVRQEFIWTRYVLHCCIPEDDAESILRICSEEAQSWWSSANPGGKISDELKDRFYIDDGDPDRRQEVEAAAEVDSINTEASVFTAGTGPEVSKRTAVAADGNQYILACNVLPVLSYRHARKCILTHDQDPRRQLIRCITQRMRRAGLMRYMVTPGGRSTIDICHHLVSKRSALLWLMRHLGLEGVDQLGEPMGVNTVYFGDEVVMHGNDLPVAEIPGILVFAVNDLKSKVPFRTNIELPTAFSSFTGPEGTQAVLENIADYAEGCFETGEAEPWSGESAILCWKKSRLRSRLEQRCQMLSSNTKAEPDSRITYRRLEAAVAALTALTRQGAGLDDFAQEVIDIADNIGRVAMQVKEKEFEDVEALAPRASRGAGSSPAMRGDCREDGLLEELEAVRQISR